MNTFVTSVGLQICNADNGFELQMASTAHKLAPDHMGTNFSRHDQPMPTLSHRSYCPFEGNMHELTSLVPRPTPARILLTISAGDPRWVFRSLGTKL